MDCQYFCRILPVKTEVDISSFFHATITGFAEFLQGNEHIAAYFRSDSSHFRFIIERSNDTSGSHGGTDFPSHSSFSIYQSTSSRNFEWSYCTAKLEK